LAALDDVEADGTRFLLFLRLNGRLLNGRLLSGRLRYIDGRGIGFGKVG
jgi:hypothetical protein